MKLSCKDQVQLDRSDFPLEAADLHLELSFYVDVPREAQAAFVARALERLTERVRQGKVRMRRQVKSRSVDGRPRASEWTVPDDLNAKAARSAHRFILAVHELSTRGETPNLKAIIEKADLSAPPVYKIVKPGTQINDYVEQLIEVESRGRHRVVSLTSLGRKVAKRIRNGDLPV